METESLYTSLVEYMPAGVFRKSFDGRYEYVNAIFCELKGLTKDEILGKTPKEVVEYVNAQNAAGKIVKPPRQMVLFSLGDEHHEWILRNGKSIVVEEEYPQPDGSIDYSQVVKTPIFDSDGRVIGSQGMLFDITSQKRTEEALLNEQYLLDSLMDNSPDFIYFKDIQSRFTRINKAHANLFGLNITNAAIGKTDFDFYTLEHAQTAFDDEQKIIRTGIPIINIVEKETWLDGHITWAVTSKFPLINREGKTSGTFGVSRNITLQKQLEADLLAAKGKAEESDRLKSAFLANMSHEIRTPMNGILGFSGLLKTPHLTGEKRKKYINIIEKSGARMLNIINDIINISKIEAGQMNIAISKVDVNEQMDYILTFFRPEVEHKGIQLFCKKTVPAKETIIETDREKVYAILTNLVKNAIKFTPKGSVEFGCVKKEKFLEFFVKDTGIGIPKDRREAIFERFIQADITDTMAHQGSGLGLSISKAYVEMLGGQIWLESEEGKGSVFYFTLPYNAKPEENIVPEEVVLGEDKAGPRNDLKILIADDEKFSEMLLTELVGKYSKELLYAENGIEAVDMCRNNPDIDLVLVDVKMPIMDGYEATRQIRQFNKEVVIIAQTAFALGGDKENALKAGCNDYIPKPINRELLTLLLNKYFP